MYDDETDSESTLDAPAIIIIDGCNSITGYSPEPDDLLMVLFDAGLEPDRQLDRHGHREFVRVVVPTPETTDIENLVLEVGASTSAFLTVFERFSGIASGSFHLTECRPPARYGETPYLLASADYSTAGEVQLFSDANSLERVRTLLRDASIPHRVGPSRLGEGEEVGVLTVAAASRWRWVLTELRKLGWEIDDLTLESPSDLPRGRLYDLDELRRKRSSGRRGRSHPQGEGGHLGPYESDESF